MAHSDLMLFPLLHQSQSLIAAQQHYILYVLRPPTQIAIVFSLYVLCFFFFLAWPNICARVFHVVFFLNNTYRQIGNVFFSLQIQI